MDDTDKTPSGSTSGEATGSLSPDPIAKEPAKPAKSAKTKGPPDGGITLSDAMVQATGNPNAKGGVYTEMAAAGNPGTNVAPTFDDEFAGKGGTFAFDKNGNRVRVYEEYVDEEGETDFRPIR